MSAGVLQRRVVAPYRVPVAMQMLGRTHAYRTPRAIPAVGAVAGDVVFTRSAAHPQDARCPECRGVRR